MADAKATRALTMSLLTKLGAEAPEKLSEERANKKLLYRLSNRGLPAKMTPEETEYVKGLGFTSTAAAGDKKEEKGPPKEEASPVKVLSVTKKSDKPANGKTEKEEKKADKPAKKEKAAKAPKEKKEKKPGESVTKFIAIFGKKKSVTREDMYKEAAAAGLDKVTCRTYASWAKQNKNNPFGFHLTEDKKVLTKEPDEKD